MQATKTTVPTLVLLIELLGAWLVVVRSLEGDDVAVILIIGATADGGDAFGCASAGAFWCASRLSLASVRH